MTDTRFSVHIGAVLRVFRVAASLTQSDVAKAVYGSRDRQDLVCRIEKGRQIGCDQLERFCQVFSVRPIDVMKWAEVHRQKSGHNSGVMLHELVDTVNEKMGRDAERERLTTALRVRALRQEPGQSWLISKLCSEHACSESMLLSALSALEVDGLLKRIGPDQIVRVGYHVKYIGNLITRRAAMEQLVLDALCTVPSNLSELEAIHTEMESLQCENDQDIIDFIDADIRFHRCLLRMAMLEDVEAEQASDLTRQIIFGLGTIVDSGRRASILEEHQAILLAISAGDVKAARSALRTHLVAGIKECEDELRRDAEENLSYLHSLATQTAIT